MEQKEKELRKVKGVGEVLAKRLAEAGYGSATDLAAADPEELVKVPGITPRVAALIVANAAELAGGAQGTRKPDLEQLKGLAVTLKERIQQIAVGVRERLPREVEGKAGKKLEKAILKLFTALEQAEPHLGRKPKKTAKRFARTEARLAALAEASVAKIARGLKKSRKAIRRISPR